ncbi:MAG: NnrS family protein, partial [Pseudomonadales bacterium]|nr:NnrS family protein [Pseudomonadales bacterium]
EMLFGFVVAIIAGFLLTAVPNWTGTKPVSGLPLLLLWLLWLLARLLPFGLPESWSLLWVVVDLAFIPALAWIIARPILETKNTRNLQFIPILAILMLCNLASHIADNALSGIHSGIMVVVLIMTVVGGRVIPFFTQRGQPGTSPQVIRWLEWAVLISTAASVLAVVLNGVLNSGMLIVTCAIVAAMFHMLRWLCWKPWQVMATPLLWSLFLGYVWIPIGLLFLAFSQLWPNIAPSIGYHGLAVGAMGGLIIAMIARVSLGHTGRPLQPSGWMIAAFVCIQFAALIRVWFPAFGVYSAWMYTAVGLFWVVVFASFVAQYAGMLFRTRLP